MSSKISRKRARDKTSPITRYFERIDISSIEPLKRERARSCEGSPKPKVLMTEEKEVWSSPLVYSSLEPVVIISETRTHQSGLPDPKKRRLSVLTSLGSDEEMMEDLPLDKSALPDHLQSPPYTSSDSSDDDLKPVNLKSHGPPPAKKLSLDLNSDGLHVVDENKVIVKENGVNDYEKKASIVNDKLKDIAICSPSDSCFKNPIDTPLPPPQMSLKEVLSSCESSSYDEGPPYERDLELLVLTNGLVPLTTSQVDDVHLFNADQMSTLNLLLTEFFSVSMRLNESIDYAMMNNTPYCMIPSESMIKLWTIVTEVKADVLPDDQMYHLVVEYFQSLVTTHPPIQSSIVREQYLLFLQSIKSSFVSLLISKERWKVELLSVIVSLLLSDYYHHKNNEPSSPLFVSLFWKAGVNLVNSDIRELIQTAVDVYKTQDSSIKSLQMDILTQLFFLIYTECEDLKSDLSIAFSSLSSHSLITAVSSLRPLKLRDYMYTRNNITLPDSFTHQSMDIYLLINSNAS